MATRSTRARKTDLEKKVDRLEELLINGEVRIMEINDRYEGLERKYKESLDGVAKLQHEVDKLKRENACLRETGLEEQSMSEESSEMIMQAISGLKSDLQSQIDTIRQSSDSCSQASENHTVTSHMRANIPQRLINWPTFDSKNIRMWIEKLDQIKLGFGLDDQAFISTLKLQSDADLMKRIRLEESKNSEITWVQLREQILRWFEPQSKTKRAINMYQRQQAANESSFAYACDKLDMIARLGESFSDREKIEMVVAGLQKDERISISNKQTDSLDELVNHLHDLDSILKRNETAPAKTLVIPVKSNSDSNKNSFVGKKQETQRKSYDSKHNSKARFTKPKEINDSKPRDSSEIVCHNCWSNGHYMKDCDKPKFYAIKQMRALWQKSSDGKSSEQSKN